MSPPKATPMIKQYLGIKEQHPDAILFFRIIEIAYFEPKVDHHGEHGPQITVSEAPATIADAVLKKAS